MGFNLICTLLFVLVLFMLVYNYDDKIKIIDTRQSVEDFDVNGDFEDLKIADIMTPEGSDIYLDYSKCDDSRLRPDILPPNDILRAVTGRSYRDNVIYQDYSMTADEAAAVTGILLQRDRNMQWKPIRTFEHDSKNL